MVCHPIRSSVVPTFASRSRWSSPQAPTWRRRRPVPPAHQPHSRRWCREHGPDVSLRWTGGLLVSRRDGPATGVQRGQLKSEEQLAAARRQEAVLGYAGTVQRAFQQASDALTSYQRLREFREQQELLEQAATDARRLADIRYQGGATSYLEVLDADTRLFASELGLARAREDELDAYVEVYRALGGGWQ